MRALASAQKPSHKQSRPGSGQTSPNRIERSSSAGSPSKTAGGSGKKPWNQSFIDFVSQLDSR
jgi:hypothetical protein